ncbi:MAG: hypothetical protein ACK4RK_09530 [Gemmataceae bacterium]
MESERRQRLARMIQKEVRVQMKRYAMARGRDIYINKLETHLNPALDHYLRIELANLNGLGGQAVLDWQNHEAKHLRLFEADLRHTTKQAIDRRVAFQTKMTQMRAELPAYLRSAEATVKQDYSVSKLTPLPVGSEEGFWKKVQAKVDEIYPPDTSSTVEKSLEGRGGQVS